MSIEKLLAEFDSNLHLFEKCSVTTEQLLHAVLEKHGLRVHKLECRVKHRDSLKRKIETKTGKYDQLSEITDIVAFRIITFFEDDVDKVAEIIKSEFDIDEDNSIDKRLKDSEKFGYQSLHYVFTYQKGRTSLLEYEQFKELKCEIQIRSILQHAWAEIEHDIGYKSEAGIPLPAKRNFMRIAALLETADLEFIRLRDTLVEYNKEISEKVVSNPQSVLIDKNSLQLFISQNIIVKQTKDKITSEFDLGTEEYRGIIEELVHALSLVEIKNIDQLKQSIEKNQHRLEIFTIEYMKKRIDHISAISTSFPIFTLIMLLLIEEERIHLILNKMQPDDELSEDEKKYKEDLLSAYQSTIEKIT